MSNLWHELVTDNPLMVKAMKSLSMLKGLRTMPPSSWVVLSLVALIYLVLVGSALKIADVLDPGLFLYLMMTVVVLMAATVLHNSLAGEREKRTMDLLLVAPVTARQIVASKLVKVVLPIGCTIVACVVPAIVLAVVRANGPSNFQDRTTSFPLALVMTIVLTLATALMVTGTTVFVSSINRTTASALTATLGVLFLWFIVLPIFIGTFSVVNQKFSENLGSYHPFVAMTRILYHDSNTNDEFLFFIVSTALHTLIGAAGLVATTRRLEQERKTGVRQNA
jgi:ABC-type Na+ efflux pump permease subunit